MAMPVLIYYTLLSLYQFTRRRGLFCLRRIRGILVELGFPALVPEVEQAIGVYTTTLELEEIYNGTSAQAHHGPQAVELDNELSRSLGALDDALAAEAKAFGSEAPRGKSATDLRAALFPKGIGYVTALSFVEKEAQVTFMLERLEATPERVQALRDLGAWQIVERVASLVTRYREVIQVTKPRYADLREAHRACQEQLCRVTALLLGRRATSDVPPEEIEALDQALNEILSHQAAIRQHRRRRRRPVDDFELDDTELGFDDASVEDHDEAPAADEEEHDGADAALPPIAQPLSPPKAGDADAGAA